MNLEKFLKIALFLQLILLVFLTFPSSKKSIKDYKLSELQKGDITNIVLTEKDKALNLKKVSDVWVLSDKFDFPADQEKVSRMLEGIFTPSELRLVGKSKNALIKYKLTDKDFVEKVSVTSANNKTDTLLLGDTPEFKKIYVRNEKSQDSFITSLSKFDLGTDVSSWYKKNFLGFTKELVKKISFNSFSLIKDKDDFNVENLKEGETLDKEKLDFLINKLFSLSFTDIQSSEKVQLEAPDFKIEVLREDGQTITLSFKKLQDKFLLKVTNMPWDFEISKNSFNDLKEVKREEVLKK